MLSVLVPREEVDEGQAWGVRLEVEPGTMAAREVGQYVFDVTGSTETISPGTPSSVRVVVHRAACPRHLVRASRLDEPSGSG